MGEWQVHILARRLRLAATVRRDCGAPAEAHRRRTERFEQIKNLVERGMSRAQVAEPISVRTGDAWLGSL
jgi:hypothetical protein